MASPIQSPAVREAHPVLDWGGAHVAELGLLHCSCVRESGD